LAVFPPAGGPSHGTRIKVYLVQLAADDGTLRPEVVAAKLTHLAAHTIAKRLAPARVIPLVADKTDDVNGEVNCSSRGGSSNGLGGHQRR